MKTKLWALLIGALAGAHPVPAEEAGAEDIKRIGIYDSRSVAIAFVGSEVYKKTRGKLLAAKMDEQRKAREEGDKKKLEELEAWGKAQQELLHRQGFSTAPVDDILAHISGPLAEIRKEANVQLLISKWDRKKLALHESAETVDVTVRLVDAFKPNERQRKHALEIRKHDPVPLDELKDDPE